MRRLFQRPVMRSFALFTLALTALGSLAGCGLIEPEKAPPACPELVVIKDAQEMTRFKGDGRDLTDVSFEAEINNFIIGCALDEETNTLENQVVLRFEATQGPANDGKAPFSYFIAVATQDRKILTRESFDLEASFDGNNTTVAVVDNVYPSIPLRPGQTGEDYVVFIGFELSRGELYYNRTRF